MARNQVEVGVRNGSEEQRFARFRFRDLDFVSIVVDLDDVADRALWGAIGPMLIAPETDFRVVRPTIWHTHSFPSARAGPDRSVGPKRAPIGGSGVWRLDFRSGKHCLGLDQCQTRLYTAILRHIVLVMAALAICAVTAAQLKDRTGTQPPPPVTPDQAPSGPGMIPLTVPEIKRLLASALTRPGPRWHPHPLARLAASPPGPARWSHQRVRLNREYTLVN